MFKRLVLSFLFFWPATAARAEPPAPVVVLKGGAWAQDCLTSARLVTRFEGGKAAGVELSAIQPGSVYDRMGFHNGDVILRIDEVELQSLEQSLKALLQMEDSKTATVKLQRADQTLILRTT